jgi:enterochelin esterase-like enzyme
MKNRMSLLLALLLGLVLIFNLALCAHGSYGRSGRGEDEYFLPMEKVFQDDSSPTGYYVTFTYESSTATDVWLWGPVLADPRDVINRPMPKTYEPEEYIPGRYLIGYSNEWRRQMVRKPGTNTWTLTIPVHAGVTAYQYVVTDPTKGWVNKTVVHEDDFLTPGPWTAYRRWAQESSVDGTVAKDGKVFFPVYVPYHPKQANPILENRARYELPRRNPAERGTVEYRRLDAPIVINPGVGTTEAYIGVYLPPGYSATRAEPYKVVYLCHGGADDETDFMTLAACPNILDNLLARGEIEPTVLVTWAWGRGQGQTVGYTEDYLLGIVIPYVESSLNVSREPSGKAYGGFSSGGRKATELWGVVGKDHFAKFGYWVLFSSYPDPVIGDTTGMTQNQIIQSPIWKRQTYDTVPPGQKMPFVLNTISLFDTDGSKTNAVLVMNALNRIGVPSSAIEVYGAHEYIACAQSFTAFAKYYLWKSTVVKQ